MGYYPATREEPDGIFTIYKPLPSFGPLHLSTPLVEAPRGSTANTGLRAYPVVRQKLKDCAAGEGVSEGDLLAVLLNLWMSTPSPYRQEALDYWQRVKAQQSKKGEHTP